MSAYTLPVSRWFYQGAPAAAGEVTVYQTGTTTKVAIYADGTLATPAANPVTLDGNGECKFYVGSAVALRLDVRTAGGTLIASVDPVYPTQNLAGLTAAVAELNYLAGVTPGTVAASKAIVADANRNVSSLASLNNDQIGGYHNLLANAAFAINQLTKTSAADDAYGHDCWYALTESGSVTISTPADQENGLPYMARLTQPDASAKRVGYAQVIEGRRCKQLRGKQVTFKVGRYRCSAAQAVRFAVLEWTGAEDAVTSDVVNNWSSSTFTAGNFFLASNLTVSGTTAATPAANTLADGPALTVTLGSAFNNLVVFAWTEAALAQNGTLDLGKAQIEIGDTATAFESRSYESDLLLVKRYHPVFKSTTTGCDIAPGRCYTTTQANFTFQLDATPRVPITGVTVSNATHFQVLKADGTAATSPALTFNAATDRFVTLTGTVASGLVAGNASSIYANSLSGTLEFTGAQL